MSSTRIFLPILVASLGTAAVATSSCNDAGPQAPEVAELTTACPSTNVVEDPTEFLWTYHPVSANNPEAYYSGTLEYGMATFDLDGESLTTRAYRQQGGEYSIPGPTIKMAPGNKYVLSYHNLLPFEPVNMAENVFKDPNVSNLHTHGLHISGETPSDDVTRFFEGGFGGDYVYDIPADHMGGTFWYHAHRHGSTFLQVSSGAFGLMLIDDGNDGLPANVASMTERQVLLGYLDSSVAGTGGDTIVGGSFGAGWTVNGQVNGSLCAPQNEWQHWRLLLADADAKPKTVGVGANCEVALLARDGVWRTSAPKILTGNDITLTGASRADFAVRCSDDSEITINGNAVANVFVDGVGNSGPHPYAADGTSMWSADRPDYLRDLSNATGVNTETVRMGARTINGSKMDMHNATFTLPADSVQEWDIRGAGQHPFHLHIYHFQASSSCGGDYEEGEYYDTMASSCAVRFDMNVATSTPYDGKTIMHCHILEHEDQGAMGWMDVQGGTPAPTFPADGDLATPYANSYPLGMTGPFCGDSTCDAGEDQCNCASDCGTPPGSELVCNDGLDLDCDGNVDCDDSDCEGIDGCPAAPFCGDATCDAGEDQCNCASDCGTPPGSELTCEGGLDEDCDGNVDCADSDCSGDAACAPAACDDDGVCEAGEDCTHCGGDCASKTNGPPSGRYCCGDGVQASGEGNGNVCDGNY